RKAVGMTLNVSDLIAALPAEVDEGTTPAVAGVPEVVLRSTVQPVPVGRYRRLSALGTLQAKIAAAYLFHWLRGWFHNADANKRLLAETHWRSALRMLD